MSRAGMLAVRGNFVYTVTVQQRGSEREVDRLLDRIASSWRWVEPSGRSRAKLDRLSQLTTEFYEVRLPDGWRATRASDAQGLPPGVDTIWRGYLSGRFATNVNVGRVDARSTDLAETVRQVIAEARRDARTGVGGVRYAIERLARGPDTEIGGEPAATIAYASAAPGLRLRHLQAIVLRDGQVHLITLSAQRQRFARDRRTFLTALQSWRWR